MAKLKVTMAKIERYMMSGQMAANPVSFRSSDLKPWTAKVKGSTLARERSHHGKA
jgi:hypothetical protein